MHTDLAGEHVLIDPGTRRVSGIIDWSEISIGDPTIDVAGMFHWGGRRLAQAVLSQFDRESDHDLLERARFFAAARGVGTNERGLMAELGRITCPQCGVASVAAMPDDACLHFFECLGCRTVLRPRPGDCCVFCSYGDAPCPPRRKDLGRQS